VVVRRQLHGRYASVLEGMEMERKTEQTVLTGAIIEQPHLHAILERINGLGLELGSVQSCPEKKKTEQTDSTRGGGSAASP